MREELLTVMRQIFERNPFAERLAYSPDEAAELLGISRELAQHRSPAVQRVQETLHQHVLTFMITESAASSEFFFAGSERRAPPFMPAMGRVQ